MSKKKSLLHGLPAALIVLSAAISICAQNQPGSKHNSRPQQVADSSGVSGTATTAYAAAELGRNFITMEMDPEYVQVGRDRLATIGVQA